MENIRIAPKVLNVIAMRTCVASVLSWRGISGMSTIHADMEVVAASI